MKKAFEIAIENWIGSWDSDPTLASLRIEAGDDATRIPVTEVFDTAARTVRPHVNLSAYALAQWLLVNWWRLRWEPGGDSSEWSYAHSLAAIGEGYVWPPLSISCDGEYVQLRQVAEQVCDVSSIRYLNGVALDIPAGDFETAVDDFLDQVIGRLRACGRGDEELTAVRHELAEERANPEMAMACSLQARAGFDPGDAPDGWMAEIHALGMQTGSRAIGEVAAALPGLAGGIATAQAGLNRMRRSRHGIDLTWLPPVNGADRRELPWQKGARLAKLVRQHLGQLSGPIQDQLLSDCFGTRLPMAGDGDWPLGGGFRSPATGTRVSIAVPRSRPESQRFYLARVVASALLSSPDDAYLAVTGTATSMQKAERSFAQEFLCPWDDLDAFTDEHGLGDDDIMDAADAFHVSEWMVLSTLVNHGKLSRERLPHPLR